MPVLPARAMGVVMAISVVVIIVITVVVVVKNIGIVIEVTRGGPISRTRLSLLSVTEGLLARHCRGREV